MTKPGLFITIEGIEGVGKSTVMKAISEELTALGVDFMTTREPGGTPMAERIRKVLLDPTDEIVNVKTELLLIFACRSQHVENVIQPAINSGQWVVSDRFTDASYAYQCGGRGVPDAQVQYLEQFVQGDFRPNHILLLDAPVDMARKRIENRGALDRIEQERVEFFERVREKYLQRARIMSDKYIVVDASQALDDVVTCIRAHLQRIHSEYADAV